MHLSNLFGPACEVPLTSFAPARPETETGPNNPRKDQEMHRRKPQSIVQHGNTSVSEKHKEHGRQEQTQYGTAKSRQAHIATKFEMLHRP